MTSPTELYEQARAALAEQRTDAADLLLRRALAVCGPSDAETRLRVRLSSSWVTFERSGPAAALAEVRAVAADAALLPHVAAAAGVQEGIVLARSGELDAALAALGRVDPDSLPPPDRVRLFLNRGTLASELRRLDAAVTDLRACAELAGELGAMPLLFMARHNLGWVLFVRGQLPEALAAMREADAIDVDLDRGTARLDRARVLLEAGLVDEGRAAGRHRARRPPPGRRAGPRTRARPPAARPRDRVRGARPAGRRRVRGARRAGVGQTLPARGAAVRA